MDVINNRRSVRKYKNIQIEPEKIDKLMRAAMQAPSAANQQPWEFLVIQDKEGLAKLAEIGAHAAPVAQASAAVVMLADKERLRFPENWQQDMSAATQNLLLEAAALGLGALWTGVAPSEERMAYLTELYNLPANINPFCLIALGYPQDDQGNHFVDRYDAARIHFEQF